MYCVENSERIAKCLLLSLLCFDSVFSAAIEADHRLEVDRHESINGEYKSKDIEAEEKDILNLDFFRYTTRKRYVWEDWDLTTPTRHSIDYRDNSSSKSLVVYFVIALSVAGVVCFILYVCIRRLNDAYSDSSIPADRFTTVHPPPQRTYQSTQVHRPSTGTNPIPDWYSQPMVRNVVSELDSFGSAVRATGATVSFSNYTYATSTQNGRKPDNAVAEKPPDYSTVALNDLLNPMKPAFPVVKKDNETPPPEYGKENQLLNKLP